MIGGERGKAGTEQRIGAGGEHIKVRVGTGNLEGKAQPLRSADPVFLHQPDLFGPILQPVQPGDQIIGEIGDAHEPLAQPPPLDDGAGTPAAAIDDLFIGENGHVDRIPIDRRFLAIDQPGSEHIEEQRLFLAIIIRLAGRQLAAPVKGKAQSLQLCPHGGDIGARPVARMHAALHRGIFGRHPERIPPHRMQHFKTLGAAGAGDDIAHGVIADMAHVDAPRWIGKHLKHIGLGLGRCVIGAKAVRCVPCGLPARFGARVVEFLGHAERLSRYTAIGADRGRG